jgi:tetratricopeptide (TPR) repeat protein
MSLRRSTKAAGATGPEFGAGAAAAAALRVAQARVTPRVVSCTVALTAAMLVVGCASSPTEPEQPAERAAQQGAPSQQSGNATAPGAHPPASGQAAAGQAGAQAPGAAGAAAGPQGPPVAVPKRAQADFDRAVGMMRAGNMTEAELEFKQISVMYPQLSTPYVNLGLLFRKTGHLDQSEDALKNAVQRNGSSAVAWTELGATQRLRGEFQDAAASYEKAIAADPNYAAAYRNLGVVSDLYLADPERALTAFEKYKEITHEEKPVSSWIAELRQRTGKPAVRPPAPAPAAAPADAPNADGAKGDAPAASPAAPNGQTKPGAPPQAGE